MKKVLLIVIPILIFLLSIALVMYNNFNKKGSGKVPVDIVNDNNFNLNIIKNVNNSHNGNYLISPYSIEIALNMLREGSNGITKEEIDNIITYRDITNISIKNKISIANAIFMKDIYESYIDDSFKNTLKNKYKSETIIDEFYTPDKINNWVKDNTNNMISKILDDISSDFVLGLANAIAIDVEWNNKFKCENTKSMEFTNSNNKKTNVEMMHNNYKYDAKYYKSDEEEVVVVPYQSYDTNGKTVYEDGNHLEFVGILPKDNIYTYISNLTEEKLNSIDNNLMEVNTKKDLMLYLPRFKYEFDLNDFIDILINMGMPSAFDSVNADFSKIIKRDSLSQMGATNIYVGEAIHKTVIDLNENGTKAAAVTYFGLEKNAVMMDEIEHVTITFNKSFAYMIRDSKTKELLFFGVVDEPNVWNGSTCSNS